MAQNNALDFHSLELTFKTLYIESTLRKPFQGSLHVSVITFPQRQAD